MTTKWPKRLKIFRICDPGERRPFGIMETVETTEGPRTRICSGRWTEMHEAAEELIVMVRRMEKKS